MKDFVLLVIVNYTDGQGSKQQETLGNVDNKAVLQKD